MTFGCGQTAHNMINKNMRKAKEMTGRKCPICGRTENQVNAGKNRLGTQRCFCKECKKYYTLDSKAREYSEEIRQQAIKTYYAGASGRSVGKVFGFSKANVYNWIKKTAQDLRSNFQILELNESYWFTGEKPNTETHENTYVITMVSRLPRQIVVFDVVFDKAPERIQKIVDNDPEAEYYCTDGYLGYIDIVYPGKPIRNAHDKSDTFTVESINSDLRHYIPILRRRSRCFPRKLEPFELCLNFSFKPIMLSEWLK